jgi:hypothetical protein
MKASAKAASTSTIWNTNWLLTSIDPPVTCCRPTKPLSSGFVVYSGTGFSREEAWVTDITFAV